MPTTKTTTAATKPASLSHGFLLAQKPKDKPYKVADDHALYLYVPTSGKRKWKFDFRIADKTSTITLGDFPAVTLLEARALRDKARTLAKEGINPLDRREAIKQGNIDAAKNTVYAITNEWFDLNMKTRSKPYRDAGRNYLDRYLKESAFGAMAANEVRPKHVSILLQSIAVRNGAKGDERKADGAPHVASRLRGFLDGAFRRAITLEITDQNPVSALRLSDVVKKPEVRHNAALEHAQLKHLIRILPRVAEPISVLYIRLMLLTATRSTEVRAAKWGEFDLDNARWSIPSTRTKMKRPHLVPLSPQALAVLEEVRRITKGHQADDYLFKNERDPKRMISHTVANKAFIRAGFAEGDNWFRSHGCRGTFATWADEQRYNSKAVDRSLAHVEKNSVRRAYSKAELLPERTEIMQKWGEFLESVS